MTEPATTGMILDPGSIGLAEAAAGWKSAYLHIPFCDRVCPYCDFAVVAGRDDTIGRYLAALHAEIELEPGWVRLDAVFFGGGTPSKIRPAAIGALVGHLASRFGLSPSAEVTLEANPEDVDLGWTEGMVEAGVNRVSLGVQSLDQAVLDQLGRRHTHHQVVTAVDALQRAGMPSISIDLIFGTPGESLDSWRRTVGGSLDLGIQHVSTYALTVEPATVLGREVRRGAPAPDADDQADKWELAAAALAGAGFGRYEVSNYAKTGHVCRYNLSVWGRGEYLAFGVGAHRFRDSVRARNVRRLDTYLDRVEAGIGAVQGTDVVEGWAAEIERLMLGVRRVAGVWLGEGGRRLNDSPAGKRLLEAGVVEVEGDRLMVSRPLLTDAVVRAVLAIEEP